MHSLAIRAVLPQCPRSPQSTAERRARPFRRGQGLLESKGMRTLLDTLLTTALGFWGIVGVFSWILRDGLGPDSVDSSGWAAFERFFWTWSWGPIAIGLVTVAALMRRSRRAAPQTSP